MRLVALGHERLGLEEFVEAGYFDGPIYIDAEKRVYKALGASRASVFSIAKPSMWKAAARAKKKGFTGNMAGDGFQMGGLMVLEPNGAMVYRFAQPAFGVHAPLDEVLEAARNGAEKGAPPAALGAEDLRGAAEGDEPDPEAAAEVKRRIADEAGAHVFAHSRCPYSDRAKRVFAESLKVPFGVTDLDQEERGADMRLALIAATGQDTYPWVFVRGELVPGGGDGTLKAFLDGELDHLKQQGNK